MNETVTGMVNDYERLWAVGYRAAYSVLGRRADAEDCAQEALARALVRWSRIAEYATPWVARVAINLAFDRARRVSREARPIGEVPHADPLATQRHDLVQALRALPRRQRQAVALRYLVDLSEQETARTMGCSIGTVKSASARGLARLRQVLGPAWQLD